jgi:hypothetical protein
MLEHKPPTVTNDFDRLHSLTAKCLEPDDIFAPINLISVCTWIAGTVCQSSLVASSGYNTLKSLIFIHCLHADARLNYSQT